MGGLSGEPVSSDSWDPDSEDSWIPGGEFRERFLVLRGQADNLAAEARSLLEAMRSEMAQLEPPAGMTGDWIESPASPAFYVATAIGYLTAAAQGTACYRTFPKSDFRHSPPPMDKWCCDHYPQHCW